MKLSTKGKIWIVCADPSCTIQHKRAGFDYQHIRPTGNLGALSGTVNGASEKERTGKKHPGKQRGGYTSAKAGRNLLRRMGLRALEGKSATGGLSGSPEDGCSSADSCVTKRCWKGSMTVSAGRWMK